MHASVVDLFVLSWPVVIIITQKNFTFRWGTIVHIYIYIGKHGSSYINFKLGITEKH